MTGEPGGDRPEQHAAVDVHVEGRDELLASFVAQVVDDVLVLEVGRDRAGRRVALEPGLALEVLWLGRDEVRAVPALLVSVTSGEQPGWRVALTGPAARGQRRTAVRAPLSFPVTLRTAAWTVEGAGTELSESGFGCVVPEAPGATSGRPAAPVPERPAPSFENGDVLTAVLALEGEEITGRAEVVRRRAGDQRLELALRFFDPDERREDTLRRHVFARLRALRSRGVL